MAVKRINESASRYNLGDEVSWNNDTYIIIDDSDEDLLRLRPIDKFQDTDFDDIESGDSSEDIFLSRYQLGKEGISENMRIIKEDRDTWTKETRTLARVCESTGYKLVDALWDEGILIVQISPLSEYTGEIYVRKQRDGSITISAGTTSYGSLNLVNYEKFADQARKTYTLLKYLNEFDFDKLEHINSK